MQRCLELAKFGAGYVAPNPMVGAVLVHDDRIIGEGWHKKFGEPHGEVNCINSVMEGDKQLISQSTLYVSLEPCVHFGKTPPCTGLIIKNKISKVVIGCRDPFEEVDARLNDLVGQGKGIEKLKAAGVEVMLSKDEVEEECRELNKRFFTFHTKQRPFVILKWAQTGDGKMAAGNRERLLISSEYSNRLVHQWRSEEAAILVGTNTALLDNPELTTRLWPGNSPVRLVVDMNLKLPASLKIFNKQARTIIFNSAKLEEDGSLLYYKLTKDESVVHQIMNALYQLKIQSVIVEGGAKLLQSFIDEGIWDEARVIKNDGLNAGEGLDAPKPGNGILVESEKLFSDTIEIYIPATDDH